jgi:hypothetical protein
MKHHGKTLSIYKNFSAIIRTHNGMRLCCNDNVLQIAQPNASLSLQTSVFLLFWAVKKGGGQREDEASAGPWFCSKVGLVNETTAAHNFLICGLCENDALCFPCTDLVRFRSPGRQ